MWEVGRGKERGTDRIFSRSTPSVQPELWLNLMKTLAGIMNQVEIISQKLNNLSHPVLPQKHFKNILSSSGQGSDKGITLVSRYQTATIFFNIRFCFLNLAHN